MSHANGVRGQCIWNNFAFFVCEQQLALTGGRSSSFKHINTEILAFPITLGEGVFALCGREENILEILQVKRARTLKAKEFSVFTKASITIIILQLLGVLNKLNLVVPHSVISV